jgi:hypothetical protein
MFVEVPDLKSFGTDEFAAKDYALAPALVTDCRRGALWEFARAIFRDRVTSTRLLALAGPQGVGKSYLAQLLASTHFVNGGPLVYIVRVRWCCRAGSASSVSHTVCACSPVAENG